MEQELFDWIDFDGDYECMIFHQVTLKRLIGNFAPGCYFDRAIIMRTDKGNFLQF